FFLSGCALIPCPSNLVLSCVCFFFSSRRRHTSSKRDWSSDVCSSDLTCRRIVSAASLSLWISMEVTICCTVALCTDAIFSPEARSEERRVGKEWGCGGGG